MGHARAKDKELSLKFAEEAYQPRPVSLDNTPSVRSFFPGRILKTAAAKEEEEQKKLP